jgi:hypothetical protein
MALFKSQKPRSYHHEYIYHDERKEKLAKIEERAKREMGLIEENRQMSREDIKGAFVNATKHLKRRKESGRQPVSSIVLIFLIIVLVFLMRYLLG